MTSNNLENYITGMNSLIQQNNSNMNLLINAMTNNQVIINNYLSLIRREQLNNDINVPQSESIHNQNQNINENIRQGRNNINIENNQFEQQLNNENNTNTEHSTNQYPSLNRNLRYNIGLNNDNIPYVSYVYDLDNQTINQTGNNQISPIESLLRLISQSYQVPQTNTDASNNTNQIRIINNDEISDYGMNNNYHIICFDNYGDIENPLNDICPITRERFYQNCRVYQIRGCRHIYNPGALQRWIDLNHTVCPYCRYNILTNIENGNTSTTDNNTIVDSDDEHVD